MEVGKWETAYIEPWPPEWLENFKEKADLIAQYLVASLEVVNVMCEVIKALLIGINDPITALIKVLIEELKTLLNDLGQLGIYFTSDWKLTKWPFEELYGGYQQAEKRMLTRLLNRMDPGRPDVSSNSLMIGVMFYATADTKAIYNLIEAIRKILQLFSYEIKGGQFSPISNLRVRYSSSDQSYTPRFGETVFTKPEDLTINWEQKNTLDVQGIQLPLPAAPNFLIEVSTVKGGMPTYLLQQDTSKSGPGGKTGKGKPKTKAYPIMRGVNGTLEQVKLFGGHDRFEVESTQKYAQAVDKDGDLKAGSNYLFVVDPSNLQQPIPIDLMKDGDTYFYQRSFLFGVDSSEGGGAEDGMYFGVPSMGFPMGISLKDTDLPKKGKITGSGKDLKIVEDTDNPATMFYFRVTALGNLSGTGGKYHFRMPTSLVKASKNGVLVCRSTTVESTPSREATLRVARTDTQIYMEAVESALIALILSHPELDSSSSVQKTPFLESDKQKISGWFGEDPKIFARIKKNPIKFRKELRNLVRAKAKQIMKRSGPLSPSVEAFVIEESKELREWKWSDYNSALPPATLRESVGLVEGGDNVPEWDDDDQGISPNLGTIIGIDTYGATNIAKIFEMVLVPLEMMPSSYTTSIEKQNREIKIPKEQYELKLSRLLLKQQANGGPTNNSYWARGTNREIEYLQGAVLRNRITGEFVTKRINNVDMVMLMSKSTWSGLKNKKKEQTKTVLPFQSSPMIYADRDEILNSSSRISQILSKNAFSPLSSAAAVDKKIWYTRDILLSEVDPLLTQAAFVLNIATSAISTNVESEWQFIRLKMWATFDSVIDFLEKLANTVAAIVDALQGMIDGIIKFIDFIQQRINEVQNLIRRINAIIQKLGLFDLPSASILFLASAGTDGIVRDIIQSEDKPQDSSSAVGWSALALIPIPFANLIVDLFYPDTDVQGLLEASANDLISSE